MDLGRASRGSFTVCGMAAGQGRDFKKEVGRDDPEKLAGTD
jgi:hypothetical protein